MIASCNIACSCSGWLRATLLLFAETEDALVVPASGFDELRKGDQGDSKRADAGGSEAGPASPLHASETKRSQFGSPFTDQAPPALLSTRTATWLSGTDCPACSTVSGLLTCNWRLQAQ
jgi:hypothetical protein